MAAPFLSFTQSETWWQVFGRYLIGCPRGSKNAGWLLLLIRIERYDVVDDLLLNHIRRFFFGMHYEWCGPTLLLGDKSGEEFLQAGGGFGLAQNLIDILWPKFWLVRMTNRFWPLRATYSSLSASPLDCSLPRNPQILFDLQMLINGQQAVRS